jgi:hypothetical protein
LLTKVGNERNGQKFCNSENNFELYHQFDIHNNSNYNMLNTVKITASMNT